VSAAFSASSRAILYSDVSSRLAAADGAGDLDSRGPEVSVWSAAAFLPVPYASSQ
jgi:hypothetical protein